MSSAESTRSAAPPPCANPVFHSQCWLWLDGGVAFQPANLAVFRGGLCLIHRRPAPS